MSRLFDSPLTTPGLIKTLSAKPTTPAATPMVATPTLAPLPTGPAPLPATVGYSADDPRSKNLSVLQKAGSADTILAPPATGGQYSAAKFG